jgi:hypothetical protein
MLAITAGYHGDNATASLPSPRVTRPQATLLNAGACQGHDVAGAPKKAVPRSVLDHCFRIDASVASAEPHAPAPDELQAFPGAESALASLLPRRPGSSGPGAIELHAKREPVSIQ